MSFQLDHVVLLLPYDDIVNPKPWLTKHFTLSPGGRHADDKTENRLVLFADGTYLELIAFIDDDPQRRNGHWWDKPYGVVDWALTTPEDAFPELPEIKQRLSKTSSGISYNEPQEGGRIKPDGQELKWRVTFPTGTGRGSVPFWCHDVTPRERRVPVNKDSTTHPSGALGMSGVLLEVNEEATASRLASATAAILNQDLKKSGHYELDVPHEIADATKPTVRIQNAAAGATRDLSLSLVVQGAKSLPNISHKIGDDTVSIVFETTK